MDNKNNNFKEFHTVHRLHGFTDVSTSFQMCVKNARLVQFARTATNCNSKNIKRKITHLIKFRWVKSYCNNSDIFCFTRRYLMYLDTPYRNHATRPFPALPSFLF